MTVQKQDRHGINPVAAGIAGAVVVAGAVAAVAMTKKENRDKVGKVVSDLSKKGRSLAHQAETVVGALQKDATPIKKRLKKQVSKLKT